MQIEERLLKTVKVVCSYSMNAQKVFATFPIVNLGEKTIIVKLLKKLKLKLL